MNNPESLNILIELIDLYEEFDDEKRKKAIDNAIGDAFLKSILQLANYSNYLKFIPQVIIGFLVRKIEVFEAQVINGIREFTDPITKQFSHDPIRISLTRVVFDKKSFSNHYKKNRQRTSDGKEFVLCPVTGQKLFQKIRHKNLRIDLEKFSVGLEKFSIRLFEVSSLFFDRCQLNGEVSKEIETFEIKIREVFDNFDIVIQKPSIEYLQQKVILITHLNESIAQQNEVEDVFREKRNIGLVDALFKIGKEYHDQNDFENCVKFLEDELLNKSELKELLSPDHLKKILEILMFAFKDAALQNQEDSLQDKSVHYLFSFLDCDVREQDIFRLIHQFIQYFPLNNLIFEKGILPALNDNDTEVIRKGLSIVNILLSVEEEEEEEEEGSRLFIDDDDDDDLEKRQISKKLKKLMIKEKSVKILRKLVSIEPRNNIANNKLKTILISLGEKDEAMKIIMKQISFSKDSESEKGKLIEEAIRIDPKNPLISELAAKDAVKKMDVEKIIQVTDININDMKESISEFISDENEKKMMMDYLLSEILRKMDVRTECLCHVMEEKEKSGIRVLSEEMEKKKEKEIDILKRKMDEKYDRDMRKIVNDYDKKIKELDVLSERNRYLENSFIRFQNKVRNDTETILERRKSVQKVFKDIKDTKMNDTLGYHSNEDDKPSTSTTNSGSSYERYSSSRDESEEISYISYRRGRGRGQPKEDPRGFPPTRRGGRGGGQRRVLGGRGRGGGRYNSRNEYNKERNNNSFSRENERSSNRDWNDNY